MRGRALMFRNREDAQNAAIQLVCKTGKAHAVRRSTPTYGVRYFVNEADCHDYPPAQNVMLFTPKDDRRFS